MRFEKLSQDRQNKIAMDLALGAVRTGSLPGLRNAIGISKGLDKSYSTEWAQMVQTERAWTLIETEHGTGAVLNLSHPLIGRMTDQSQRFRLPATSVENAERYARNEADPTANGEFSDLVLDFADGGVCGELPVYDRRVSARFANDPVHVNAQIEPDSA